MAHAYLWTTACNALINHETVRFALLAFRKNWQEISNVELTGTLQELTKNSSTDGVVTRDDSETTSVYNSFTAFWAAFVFRKRRKAPTTRNSQ